MKRIGPCSVQSKQRSDQKGQMWQKPALLAADAMEKTWRDVIVKRIALKKPTESENAVFDTVPGENKKARPSNNQPKDQSWMGGAGFCFSNRLQRIGTY